MRLEIPGIGGDAINDSSGGGLFGGGWAGPALGLGLGLAGGYYGGQALGLWGAGAGAAAGTAAGTAAGGMSGWGPAALMGGLSFLGAQGANQASERMSQEQMRFQEYMSSTAHQREVNDLIKAGLNPILSANAGASTPTGAMGQVSNPIQAAITNAMEVKSMQLALAKQEEEIELMKAQKAKFGMETTVLSKGVPEAEMKNKLWDAFGPTAKKIIEAFGANASYEQRSLENMKKHLNQGRKP